MLVVNSHEFKTGNLHRETSESLDLLGTVS